MSESGNGSNGGAALGKIAMLLISAAAGGTGTAVVTRGSESAALDKRIVAVETRMMELTRSMAGMEATIAESRLSQQRVERTIDRIWEQIRQK